MRRSPSPPKTAASTSNRMAGLGSYSYTGCSGQYRTSQPRLGPLSSYTPAQTQQQPQPQPRSYTSPKPPRANPVRPTTLQANANDTNNTNTLTSGPRAPSPVPFGTSTMDPNFCLCCPPNDMRFCDAVRVKQRRQSLRRPTTDTKGGDSGSERDYIGFATLPEQVHRKSVKRGFEFTLMVVGESGLGKSTLVNSLFLSDLYKDRVVPDASERVARTTAIARQTMDIEERGVRLRLSVVDTPGFGDALDCEDSWRAVCSYVDQQFSQFFQDESGLHRKNIQDNRVHCCLYFVPPYGHGLRQLDVEFMRRLQNKVNLVPVVAKADTLTAPELKRLKQRILDDLEEQNIQIYQFPDCDSDEDEEFKKQDEELKKSVPFAVISSNTTIEVGGKRVRGRLYPWGVVEVDNPLHSDFARLRSFLISTHMQDLKDVTHDLHYEAFRAHCISQISQQAIRERTKLKRDSVSGPGADNETDRLLLEKDEEIRRMQDMLAQMQQKLHKQSSQGSQGDGLNDLSIKPTSNQRDSVVDV